MENTIRLPFAHPIDDGVRHRIGEALDEIEAVHDVRILFACESGSRAWGFASPDSDYDVRFVYVHKLPWYLKVQPARDVIELPIDDELDINGWELRKALGLLRRSNPTLLEWLDSPVLYREAREPVAIMRDLALRSHSALRIRSHYLSMARKNFRGYLQDDLVRWKKYLYVLRPVLAARWIEHGLGIPPMRFTTLAQRLIDDSSLLEDIRELLDLKMHAAEAALGPRRPLIHAFLVEELNRAEPPLDNLPSDVDEADYDRFLFNCIMARQGNV